MRAWPQVRWHAVPSDFDLEVAAHRRLDRYRAQSAAHHWKSFGGGEGGGGGAFRGAKASRLDAIKVSAQRGAIKVSAQQKARRHQGEPARRQQGGRGNVADEACVVLDPACLLASLACVVFVRLFAPCAFQVNEALDNKATAIFLKQENPKKKSTKSWLRYEGYKAATTVRPPKRCAVSSHTSTARLLGLLACLHLSAPCAYSGGGVPSARGPSSGRQV